MKHINTISFLYQKYLDNTLTNDDITSYTIRFNRKLCSKKETRRNNAKSFCFVNEKSFEDSKVFWINLAISSLIKKTMTESNIILEHSLDIVLPLLYVTFDGGFTNRFKSLLDSVFFDEQFSDEIDNSYFLKIERSDIMLFIKVFHSRRGHLSWSCGEVLSKKIKSGHLLSSKDISNNGMSTRIDFWKYLNLNDIQVFYISVGSISFMELSEWHYYNDYLKTKKGYYPDSLETSEIILNNINKWLYLILFILFDQKEKLYIDEDFEDIKDFYIQLGFSDVRHYFGVGLFDFKGFKFYDFILNKNLWRFLSLMEYEESKYLGIFNIKRICINHFNFLFKNLWNTLKKKNTQFEISDILQSICDLNLVLDVTMDLRPKYRHPVTYDFFTTLRVIPTLPFPIKNDFVKPIIELTENIITEIETLSYYLDLTLTQNEAEDEYHDYKKFYIQKYNEQMLEKLKDPIYLADKSGDYDKAQKLISEKFKDAHNDTKTKIKVRLDEYRKEKPWEKHGIRKHLNLKPNESFR